MRLVKVPLVAKKLVVVALVDEELVIVRVWPVKLAALTEPSNTALPFLSRVRLDELRVMKSFELPNSTLPAAEKYPLEDKEPKEPFLPTTAVPASILPRTEIFLLTMRLSLSSTKLSK